ncbi:MAG: GAF domain-containing protein [Bacteroidota bacterium]
MKNRLNDVRKTLTPNDAIAIVVVILGLLIALFINEMAIRLIGICIAVLGAVALFMLISQRLSDMVVYANKPVSQSTNFRTTVKQDDTGKRMIFDDFATSFGTDENEQAMIAAREQREEEGFLKRSGTTAPQEGKFQKKLQTKFKEITKDVVGDTFKKDTSFKSDGVAFKDEGVTFKKPGFKTEAAPTSAKKISFGDDEIVSKEDLIRSTAFKEQSLKDISTSKTIGTQQIGDDTSGMRIIGKKKTPAEEIASDPPEVLKENLPAPEPEVVKAPAEIEIPAVEIPEKESIEIPQEESFKEAVEIEEKTAAPLETEVLKTVVAPEETIIEQPVQSHRKTPISTTITEMFQEDADTTPTEPRKEFDHLLSRVLMVIRSVASARTAAFFWVNPDKHELVLESYISDAGEIFSAGRRKYPISNDVISQIATHGRPEILTEIQASAELDLLPYYTKSAGTLSFIGVPVFFNNSVVGVLCADSTEIDAYDSITVGFLGHFTKLISGLVQSYTGKYDLFQSARTLEAINDFRSLISNPHCRVQDICSAIVESASHITEYFTLGVCNFDEARGAWHVCDIRMSDTSVTNLTGVAIPLEGTLLGQTILTGQTNPGTPIQPNIARIHPHEPAANSGYFVAVPLKSASHNYGALFIEANSPVTAQDISVLETLGEHAGTIIEQIRFADMLQSHSLVDDSTGILNQSAFFQRISEELVRAGDFGIPLTLCLIHIDKYSSIEMSPDTTEIIMHHVLALVQKYIHPYDVIGRLDATTLGVGISGAKNQQAQMWGERIRKETASSVVDIHGKRMTVTISIGIAEALPKADSVDTLIQNAHKVLQLSSQKTNAVTVFA